MDLYAYASIANLEPLLEMNGIRDISRLRGLRVMGAEEPITENEIKKEIRNCLNSAASFMLSYDYRYDDNCYGDNYRAKCDWYLYKDGSPNWSRIHGKFRKALKFELKNIEKRVRANFEMFNKYAGREDVLYIHTRTGGGNWSYYGCDKYLKEPWYLDHVFDCFDSTYCDIYAKVDPDTVKKLLVETTMDVEEYFENKESH